MTALKTCSICGQAPCENLGACRSLARMEAEDATCSDYYGQPDDDPDEEIEIYEPDPDEDENDDFGDDDYDKGDE